MKSALYKYRYLLAALLLIAALLNCFLRFWGDTRPFFSALMFQLWHVVFIEQKSMDVPSYNWQDL